VIGSVSNREQPWAEVHHNATCGNRACGACTSLPS
jgi:hypothetical protein